MATERQTEYLRDLGMDPRADPDDLPKAEASDWIRELQGYAQRANLPIGRPLTPGLLARLGARSDALAQPPARSAAAAPENGSKPAAAPGPSRPPPPPPKPVERPPPPPPKPVERPPPSKTSGDECWVKVELSTGVTTPLGEGATVTVSASSHHRHGPSEADAEELGGMVRRFLAREVARYSREYVSAEVRDPEG